MPVIDSNLALKMASTFHGARALAQVSVAMRLEPPFATTLSKNAVTNLVFGYGEGNVHISDNQACHAGLQLIRTANWEAISNSGLKYILSGIQLNITEKNKENCEKFYNWLVTKSPWQEVFLAKSGEEAVKCGFLLARADVPGNLLASAMIASRVATELDEGAHNWNFYVDHGASPEMAFLFCHELSRDGKGNISSKGIDSHTCYLSGQMEKREMSAFLSGKIPNRDLYTRRYNEVGTYSNVDVLMAATTGDHRVIRKCLNAASDGSKSDKVSNNPFANPAAHVNKKSIREEELPKLISIIEKELK